MEGSSQRETNGLNGRIDLTKSMRGKKKRLVDVTKFIDYRYSNNIQNEIGNSIRKRCQQKFAKYIQSLKSSNVLKIFVGPNLTDNDAFSPPSGFAIAFRKDAPLVPGIFHGQKLFSGIVALRLSGGMLKLKKGYNSDKLSASFLEHNKERIKEEMIKKLPEFTEHNLTLSNFDPYTNAEAKGDKGYWTASMGDRTSFAGIYTSKNKESYVGEDDYWLVVKCNSPGLSIDIRREMSKEQEKGGVTMQDFFLDNPKLIYAQRASERNRINLLKNLAESIGLQIADEFINDPESGENSGSKYALPSHILNNFYSTETFVVRPYPEDEDYLTYYAGMADPVYSRNSFVMATTPYSGMVILTGDWRLEEEVLAFPCYTGRVSSNYNAENEEEIDNSNGYIDPIYTKSFFTEDQNSLYEFQEKYKDDSKISDYEKDDDSSSDSGEYLFDITPSKEKKGLNSSSHYHEDISKQNKLLNRRLKRDIYRMRDSSYKSLEEKMGYSQVLPHENLYPLLVKINK